MRKSRINSRCVWVDEASGKAYRVKSEIPDTAKDRVTKWDSKTEYTVYRRLTDIVGRDNIFRQQSIQVLPKTSDFPEWTWKVDFLIKVPTPSEEILLIEAKGDYILSDQMLRSQFKRTLHALSYTSPNLFQRLIIVSTNKENWRIPRTKIDVCSVSELANAIAKKIEEITE